MMKFDDDRKIPFRMEIIEDIEEGRYFISFTDIIFCETLE